MPHAHPYIPDSLRIGSGSHASLPPDPVPAPAPNLQAATGVPLTYRSTDPPNPIQGPDIPFQPAMDRLHETLTKSVTFFAALHGEYEQDTASIRAYVDADVLDRIWKCKLDGNGPGKMSVWVFCQRWYKMRKNKYRMHMPLQLQLQNESQSRSQRRHPAYRDWILRVRYDLSMVEMALWSIRESNSRDGGCFPDTHAVGQLYTKFNMQCPVLRNLCEDVDKRESCVEFVREASQLLLWMDENMDWWKTSRMSRRLALRRWFF